MLLLDEVLWLSRLGLISSNVLYVFLLFLASSILHPNDITWHLLQGRPIESTLTHSLCPYKHLPFLPALDVDAVAADSSFTILFTHSDELVGERATRLPLPLLSDTDIRELHRTGGVMLVAIHLPLPDGSVVISRPSAVSLENLMNE